MKNLFGHLLLGAAIVSGAAFGVGPAAAETLREAVQTAVATHPSVIAAQEAAGAGLETVKEQRSAYFPEISASLSGGRMYGDNATSRGLSVTRGAGYSGLGEGTASLSQRVFDWGETGNRVDAAKARFAAAGSSLIGTQEGIALRAIQAYMGLMRASELKEKAAANLEIIDGYQKKVAEQVKAGGSDEAELNRANDFLLLAQNAATEFSGTYEQALADYIEATGDKPQGGLSAPVVPSALPASMDAAVASAFETHPQVLAAKDAIIASEHDKNAESTSYLPKVRGELSYDKRDQRDVVGGESVDARALMKMDWAYSTGGAQIARVNRADRTTAQARAQLNEVNRRIERDIHVAWSALDVARRQQATQGDRKDATANVVATYKTQYEGDKRTVIELMQAQSQAFDADVAFANADYGVAGATYALLASMGQLLNTIQGDTQTAAGSAPVIAKTEEPKADVSKPDPSKPDVAVAVAPARDTPKSDIPKADLPPEIETEKVDAPVVSAVGARISHPPTEDDLLYPRGQIVPVMPAARKPNVVVPVVAPAPALEPKAEIEQAKPISVKSSAGVASPDALLFKAPTSDMAGNDVQ